MHNRRTIQVLALSAVLLVAFANSRAADDMVHGRAQAPAPLEGVWNVTIRPYVCATGETVPGIVFHSRLMFHAGGTMTETAANPFFEPGQRSAGTGYWERIGRTSYRAVLEAYILFDSDPGAPLYVRGTQRIDQGIELIDGNHWRSSASVVFRNTDGDVVPPTGCMNAEGERLT